MKPFEIISLIRFTTPVYHPNIDEGGRICLDILKVEFSKIVMVPVVCNFLEILTYLYMFLEV